MYVLYIKKPHTFELKETDTALSIMPNLGDLHSSPAKTTQQWHFIKWAGEMAVCYKQGFGD